MLESHRDKNPLPHNKILGESNREENQEKIENREYQFLIHARRIHY